MYVGVYANYPLFLSILMYCGFSQQISEKYRISNFMKIIAVGVAFHVEGWTNGQRDIT
jgi:hypothetical protein